MTKKRKMYLKSTFILIITFLVFGFNSTSNLIFKSKNINGSNNKTIINSIDNIENNWIEITLLNNVWTYQIPCLNQRELQKITLNKIQNLDAITWNTGLESQWYVIKKTIKSADSVIYKTVLPFDSLQEIIFSFKYIDKEKKIAQWGTDGSYMTFIPISDSLKYPKQKIVCK